jgi:penicillin-binding protein 1A
VPHIINRIRTSSGRVVYERPDDPAEVLVAPAQVGAINDMLNAVVVTGTGKRAALPRHPAAGKTGTSQDFRDAWFVGYTAHFVAGVWVGNDDRRPMNRVMGGNFPARLWREVMLLAHDGLTPRALPGTVPAGSVMAGLNSSAVGSPGLSKPQAVNEPTEPDHIARMIAENATGAEQSADSAGGARSWAGAAMDGLRGLFGG